VSFDTLAEEARVDALTSFLQARVREGYLIETRTDTHAIIAPPRGWAVVKLIIRHPFRTASGRQVIAVDDQGKVTMRRAERLRS